MSHVRSHTRTLKDGRTVTVRQHDRKGGAGKPPRGQRRSLLDRLFAPRIKRQRGRATPAEEWWADDEPPQRTREQRRADHEAAKAAQRALEDYTERKHAEWKAAGNKGGIPEDDTYLDLNDAVWRAHEKWRGRPEKWRGKYGEANDV